MNKDDKIAVGCMSALALFIVSVSLALFGLLIVENVR